jgi:hypothetical protein
MVCSIGVIRGISQSKWQSGPNNSLLVFSNEIKKLISSLMYSEKNIIYVSGLFVHFATEYEDWTKAIEFK